MGQKGTQRRGRKPKATEPLTQEQGIVYYRRVFDQTNTQLKKLNLPPIESQLELKTTPAEIMINGTLEEKRKLFFTLADYNKYQGTGVLGIAQLLKKNIEASKTKKESDVHNECASEIETLWDYSIQMRGLYLRFQGYFSVLAVYLTQWDGLDREANTLTELERTFEGVQIVWPNGKRTDLNDGAGVNEWIGEKIKERNTPKNLYRLKYDEAAQAFYFDVDMGGKGLYSQIQEAAENVHNALRDYKEAAVAVTDFIEKDSLLHYSPIEIKTNIKTIADEVYMRSLISNPAYYQRTLNEKRAKGEPITKDDERRAVIADYDQIGVRPSVVKYYREDTLIKAQNLAKSMSEAHKIQENEQRRK